MSTPESALSGWTPEQIAQGHQWVEAWKRAGKEMARLRRQELRERDVFHAISLLCWKADEGMPLRPPRPTSGLIEQQHYFMKAANRA